MSHSANEKSTDIEKRSQKSNFRIIAAGFLLIAALSALQFFLISTLGDDSLKPLDKKEEHTVFVTRVLDLNFSYFREEEFDDFLSKLQKLIRQKIGYRVVLKLRKTVLVENFISYKDSFFQTDAAKNWFAKQKNVTAGVQSNFSWLKASLANADARTMLGNYYKTTNQKVLQKRIEIDFAAQVKKNLSIKDRKGNPVYYDSRKIAPSSFANWVYLLSQQSGSDFIVANVPIFFPSKKSPVDAITRGGLMVSHIVGTRSSLGGVLAFSMYPVLSKKWITKKRVAIASGLALQGIARLFYRASFSIKESSSLFYPVFGYDFEQWWNNGKRAVLPKKNNPLKHF